MINVICLNIGETISIAITVPGLSEKINYFYDPTEKLHKFDEVSVYLNKGSKSTLIVRDVAQDIIGSLWVDLYKCLHFEKELLPHIAAANIGYLNNKDTYALNCAGDDDLKNYKEKFNCSLYNLWSSNLKIETWMYTKKGIIYIEVSPTYPLFFTEDFVQDDKVFEKYLADYKPLLFAEISRSQAQEWLEKCERIIREIESEYILDDINNKNDIYT